MTLIFDIGKTNKKALVFDKDFQVVEETQRTFDEVADIDGDPTDDVLAITAWIKKTIKKYQKLDITHINFATYGATLAHLDKKGKLIAQPFNYLKKIDPSIKNDFLSENGSDFCTATASPNLDFLLNSGFQLYWLKKIKPDFFNKIHTTLHLPQYFSYTLTGQKVSEYTSIGCHTMLWDFNKNNYHDWVEREGMTKLLAPLNPPEGGKLAPPRPDPKGRGKSSLPFGEGPGGAGIHDSSAALLPYLAKETQPFLLLSTGTWSICLNPFNTAPLTEADFLQDCLFYMRPNGQAVKASRLFLGKIHDEAVEELTSKYLQNPEVIKTFFFNNDIYNKLIDNELNENNVKHLIESYHLLMYDLVKIQVQKIYLAAGNTDFEKIIIDGGFAKNDLFFNFLQKALPTIKIEVSEMSQGTALGAAIAIV